MTAEVEWTGAAFEQLEAIEVYVNAAGGDGSEIVRRVRASVERLREFPESCPYYTSFLRRLVVRELSVSCYYLYENNVVFVMSVRHDKQRPL